MRFPNSSCLLRGHGILLKPLSIPRTAFILSQPASSLSAIHHGLRQSQKSRPQGFSQSSLETAKPRRPSQSSRNGRDPDWTPPTFKIKRGKKDITDTGPGRQSRRSRFHDPDQSFGKRSLVYQMKHGSLREKMAELEPPKRSHKDRLSSSDFMRDFETSPGRPTKTTTGDRRGRPSPTRFQRPKDGEPHAKSFMGTRSFDKERTSRPSPTHFRRPEEGESHARSFMGTRNFDKERTRRPSFQRPEEGESHAKSFMGTRNFDKERTSRPDVSSYQPRREAFTNAPSSSNRFESSRNKPNESSGAQDNYSNDARGERDSRRDNDPIRVHHTTAASQFLYGRSVVEAALKDSRRQLYILYLSDGDNRQSVWQDGMLSNLARQKGVKVTKLPNDSLRLLDKMSNGRPHNGCVLEASPLPQLPLKALGALSEDPKNPGFHLELSHQSSEEAKINGTSDFVSYRLPKERNPFVLLLDGILDPGNLGAILRTAAFLGVNAIAITKSSSATLTPIALKASAGASEVTTLFSVNSTVDFLSRSKENGWLVYAAVPSTKRSKGNSHLTVDRVETYDPLSSQPTVLVIGSEGEGLTKPVRREADHEVSIPSPSGGFSNVVDSLNVSVATGILCSAFLKKQTSHMIEIEEDSVEEEMIWTAP
ncbi:RNA methyltransferase [Xylaria cubensis]|nr:RNA methyltransferase [Xylaria cubensis]